MKQLPFNQEVHMVLQNYMLTGLRSIIEKLMEFMHVMEFYLITSLRLGEKHLLQEK